MSLSIDISTLEYNISTLSRNVGDKSSRDASPLLRRRRPQLQRCEYLKNLYQAVWFQLQQPSLNKQLGIKFAVLVDVEASKQIHTIIGQPYNAKTV